MTRERRRLLAAPAVLVLVLIGCGDPDDPGAPADASRSDFCRGWTGTEQPEPDPGATTRQRAEAIRAQLVDDVRALEAVGTPADIPADAREGFEVFVAGTDDVSVEEIEASLEVVDRDLYVGSIEDDDLDKAGTFTDWADDFCGDPSPG